MKFIPGGGWAAPPVFSSSGQSSPADQATTSSVLLAACLKITVSVVQFRPWAPRKVLQQRNLEAAGGWALVRLRDLGPHRGLTGWVGREAGRGVERSVDEAEATGGRQGAERSTGWLFFFGGSGGGKRPARRAGGRQGEASSGRQGPATGCLFGVARWAGRVVKLSFISP